MRYPFTWGMGGITFYLFIVLTFTGVALMYYYHPDKANAFRDMLYIRNDVPFGNYASLTRAREVQDLIQRDIDAVNKKFARVEQVRAFRLLDTQLTAEDEELTPTMKLKRSLVQTKYADLIEQMYRTAA